MNSEIYTRTGRCRTNSVEIWRGPSRIDGAEIVVIMSGLRGSTNGKTGDMVQTYILRVDRDPVEIVARGLDASICGGCVHRRDPKTGKRSCYVNLGHGPLSVWRAWGRGNIPRVDLATVSELTTGRMVRLGSYGDPAAVPLEVWHAYTKNARGWTGYTHQARSPRLRDVLTYCQVSADSLGDAKAARAAGVGSFRVLRSGESPAPFEILCPASAEAGKVATCDTCGICRGAGGESVAIHAHGSGAKHYTTRISVRRAISLPVINPGRALATV